MAFKRGHATDVDGRGVGLGLVSEIVEARGWEITVTEGSEGRARFEVETTSAGIDDVASLFAEKSNAFEYPHTGWWCRSG